MTEITATLPPFDGTQFAAFVRLAWAHRTPDTRIFVGALPSVENKARADQLRADKRPLPVECRVHYRAFGQGDGQSLLRFMAAEHGRRNLSLKLARYRLDAASPTAQAVVEVHFAWVDIEARDDASRALVLSTLDGLPDGLRPSAQVLSGGGVHAYWFFDKPVSGDNLSVVQSINTEMTRVLSGDPSVCHVAGALRVPGTWNVNRNRLCEIRDFDAWQASTPVRHAPDDLLAAARAAGTLLVHGPEGMRAVPPEAQDALRVHSQEGAQARHGGQAHDWDDVARALSVEGNANPYGGRNRALTVFAGKVLSMGGSVEDAVSLALKKGCTLSQAEIEATVLSVARTHERKNVVSVPRTAAERAAQQAERDAATQTPAPEQDTPDAPDTPDTPDAPDTAPEDCDPTSAIARLANAIRRGADEDDDYKFAVSTHVGLCAEALIEWLGNRGLRLIYESGDRADDGWWWAYSDARGVWRLRSRTHIERAVADFWSDLTGAVPKSTDRSEILGGVKLSVLRSLGEVPWDAPDRHLIVTSNHVVLDVITGDTVDKSPDLYLTDRRCIAADYDPAATAATWDVAVRTMFDDRADKDAIARMIEEWMGSSLLGATRPRETYKALMVTGESLGGKSTLGHAVRSVLGDQHVVASDMESMSGAFGLSPFFEARASVWICDDPDTTSRMPDGLVKKLITNEEVMLNQKNRPMRSTKLNLTVGIFCNEAPRIDDGSDALYNRMLMLRSGVIFAAKPDPTDPRQRQADPDLQSKFARERAGILNRMIDGARRLLARGGYDVPAAVSDAREALHDINAPSRAFLRQCVAAMPDTAHRVLRQHLRWAFIGYMESDAPGWFRRAKVPYEMRRLYRAFAHLHPKSERGRAQAIKGARSEQEYQTRVNLTEDGLAYLARGRAVEEGSSQSYVNDPEMKQANNLAWLKGARLGAVASTE